MAEFQEVMRQNKRMCQSVKCCKCDIYRLCGEDLSKCQRFINNNPEKAEEVIMAWAAEHPEPVYPVWRDWLRDLYGNSNMTMTDILESPIDPEIAQRLNIVPRRMR